MEDGTRAQRMRLVLDHTFRWLRYIGAFVLLASGVFGGCTHQLPNARGDLTSGAGIAHEGVSITFVTLPFEPQSRWEALIAEFEQANPGVQVDIRFQEPPSDWPQQADVILGNWQGWWVDAVDRGWILDLTPLLETASATLKDDFYPGALSLYQRYGRVWALPTGIDLQVLAYSTRQFAEVGAHLPAAGATWRDIADAASRLSVGASATQSFFALPDDWMLLDLATGWITEQANGLYSVSRDGISPRLDRGEVYDAVTTWQSLAAQLTVVPETDRAQDQDELLRRVAQGQIGMAIVPLEVARRQASRYPEVAFAAIPITDLVVQRALWPTSGVFISAGTAHPQAAWRWIEFLNRQRLSDIRYHQLPTRRILGEEAGIWSRLPDHLKQVARDALANLAQQRMPPDDKAVRVTYDALAKVLSAAQRGVPDLRGSLQQAQAEAVADIAAWRKVTDFPPRAQIRVAPPPVASERIVDFYVTGPSEAYAAAARAFEAQHPGWRIRVGFLGLQQPAGCLALPLEEGTITTAISAGLARDLEPFMEADLDVAPDRFLAQALAITRWQGRTYALPGSLKPLVLRYNPTIFGQLGMAPPDASWDVDKILAAAGKIATAGRGWVGFLPTDRDLPFLLEQQGLDLFTKAELPQPRFADPQVLVALEHLRTLSGKRLPFPPTVVEVGALADEGLVAMWLSALNARPDNSGSSLSNAIRLRGDTIAPLQVTAYGITPNAPEPYICWQWIKYLVQQGISAPGEIPALKELTDSEAARRTVGEELHAAYLGSLGQVETARSPQMIQGWALWWFFRALGEARTGDLTSALQTAQDKAETFIACLGPAGENDLDRAARCARQVDPTHPLAQLRREQ